MARASMVLAESAPASAPALSLAGRSDGPSSSRGDSGGRGPTSSGSGHAGGTALRLDLRALGVTRDPALLLVSDGYETTAPLVSRALRTAPVGVPIHAIALGAASDQALLQQVAASTGGSYFFSPEDDELFQVYNVARAAAVGDDLIFEESIPLRGGDESAAGNGPSFTRQIVIDEQAEYVDITVATQRSTQRLQVMLRAVAPASLDVSSLRQRAGDGYQVLHLVRPEPGVYELTVTAPSSSPTVCAVAAYVRSPLRLRLGTVDQPFTSLPLGRPIALPVAVLQHGELVPACSVSATVFAPTGSVRLLAARWRPQLEVTRPFGSRGAAPVAMPSEIERARAAREQARRFTGTDPLAYVRRPARTIQRCSSAVDPRYESPSIVHAVTSDTIDGTYNVRVDVQGHTASGHPFTRVGLRSVRVG